MAAARPLVCGLLLSCLWGCSSGPQVPISGVWHGGQLQGDRFLNEYLILRQEGPIVSGEICAVDLGHVLYRNVPVDGRYPRFSFLITQDKVVECEGCVGVTVSGELLEDGTIHAIEVAPRRSSEGQTFTRETDAFVDPACHASTSTP
jgi:hypothetical protein